MATQNQNVHVEFKGIAKTVAKLEAYDHAVVDRELPRAMEEIGAKIEGDTKAQITTNGQVDTGNMRASISHEVTGSGSEIAAEIGSNVLYTPFQEALYPFLAPSVEKNKPFAEQKLKDAVDVPGF